MARASPTVAGNFPPPGWGLKLATVNFATSSKDYSYWIDERWCCEPGDMVMVQTPSSPNGVVVVIRSIESVPLSGREITDFHAKAAAWFHAKKKPSASTLPSVASDGREKSFAKYVEDVQTFEHLDRLHEIWTDPCSNEELVQINKMYLKKKDEIASRKGCSERVRYASDYFKQARNSSELESSREIWMCSGTPEEKEAMHRLYVHRLQELKITMMPDSETFGVVMLDETNPSTEQGNEMSFAKNTTDSIRVETKTFVYLPNVGESRELKNLAESQLYSAIKQSEDKIKELNAIEHKPASLRNKIAKLEEGIEAIVAYLDSQEPTAEEPEAGSEG